MRKVCESHKFNEIIMSQLKVPFELLDYLKLPLSQEKSKFVKISYNSNMSNLKYLNHVSHLKIKGIKN
jgi:hypothetical protein